MEYHGATVTTAMQTIEEKVRHNTEQVLKISLEQNIQPRRQQYKWQLSGLKSNVDKTLVAFSSHRITSRY